MDAETFKVLLAVDHSEHSEIAVNYYINRLHKEGNEVVVAHIINMPETANKARIEHPEALQGLWQEGQAKAKVIEAKYDEKLRSRGITSFKIHTDCHLNVGHGLCHVARDEKVALVVMGTRGSGVVRRTLIGSVSDYVMHHAHVPVLVCRHH